MEKNKFKVDFIGIGAPRSGTTWISACLTEHPQICIPKEKEVQFFNKQYNYNQGIKFYQNFFKDCKNKIKGEFTTFYYTDEKVAQKIKRYFPEVKIIVSLRNPIERAFSAYSVRKKEGAERQGNFSKAVEKNKIYIRLGFYYYHLSKFLPYFKPENILILIYEDGLKNPTEFIKTIYKFLNVDENFVSKTLEKRIYASMNVNYRSLLINRMITGRKTIKKNKLGFLIIRFFKMIGINKLIKLIIKLNIVRDAKQKREKIDIATRQKLRQVFSKDIRQLENMIDRNLSFWK